MSSTLPPTPASRGQLLAVLGVGFGLAVTIGNTIGAGILRTPGVIAAQLQTFWLFIAVWVVGGLYALLGANALAELGTLVPRSGGQYVFVRHGLGDYAGFVVGWSDWISTCGTTAAVAIVVGEYTRRRSSPRRARSRSSRSIGRRRVFTIVQWLGVRGGGAVQNVTSVVKALALLLFVAACFWFGTRIAVGADRGRRRARGVALRRVHPRAAVRDLHVRRLVGGHLLLRGSEGLTGSNIPRAMLGGVAVDHRRSIC